MGRNRAKESVDTDQRFHQLEWRIQRIGWLCVFIFLGLAFAGLFGGGPLSHARSVGAAGSVDYERFVRSGNSTDLVVTPAHSDPSGLHRVEITSDFLEAFRIERINPQPTATRMVGPHLVYEFAAAAPGASISFHVHPERLWRHTAEVRIDSGAPLTISLLTYP
jgi:hypothetical protein